jgi:flagellar biosynthesis/type III secretory pathway M-ring protein FliF/YscJ
MAIYQAIERARVFLHASPPAARRVIGIALVGAALALVFWWYGSGGDEDEYLLGGRTFDAGEIAAAQAAFAKAKLNGARIEGGRIRVPRDAESSYVSAMADAGALPEDFHKTWDKALNQLSAFTPSKSQEALINNAKQSALAEAIRKISGIEQAAVFIDQGRQRGLVRKETGTASVMVWPESSRPLDPRQLEAIRKLVKHSTAGLADENIYVIDAGNVAAAATVAVAGPQSSSDKIGLRSSPALLGGGGPGVGWRWAMLAALAVGGSGWLGFYCVRRSKRSRPGLAMMPAAESQQTGESFAPQAGADIKGRSPREQVANLVRERPQTAVHLIRGWMSS